MNMSDGIGEWEKFTLCMEIVCCKENVRASALRPFAWRSQVGLKMSDLKCIDT